jgi:hypothetical protein
MAEVMDPERNFLAEKSDSEPRDKEVQESPLKLDANGIPLVPQPSDRKDDPLVRSVLPDSNQTSCGGVENCQC